MRVMKFAEVLDESLEVLKKNTGTILMFNLLYGLIYIGAFILIGIFSFIFAVGAATMMMADAGGGIIFMIGLLVFIFLTVGLGQLAGNVRIGAQYLNQEKIDFKNALGTAFKKMPTLAVILFAYGLSIAPMLAISYKIVNEFDSYQMLLMEDWVQVVIVLAIMLAIVLIFTIVTNFFVFTIHAVVLENVGPIRAITRSFKLVTTQFWRVFGAMFLIQFLIAAIQYSLISFVGYCGGILYLLSEFLSFAPEGLYQIAFILVPYLQWPVNIMSYLFLNPLLMIMTTLLYINIRFKTEGYDLTLHINQLERNIESAK